MIVSLMTNAVQHLPMGLLAIQTAFWKNVLLTPKPVFKLGYLSFHYSVAKVFFYNLDTNPLSDTQFANISSKSVNYFLFS